MTVTLNFKIFINSLDYADDICLLFHSVMGFGQMPLELEEEAREVELKINIYQKRGIQSSRPSQLL